MSNAASDTERGIDTSGTTEADTQTPTPTVESGRFARAVTEDMSVKRVAERFYEIHSQSGNTYEIDLQTGACTCPDCQQRGDRFVCKHAIRASLVEIIAEGVTTRTVAKVAGYVRDPEHECPAEGIDCVGPLAGNGELPCPTCCDATRTENLDEYDIWTTVVVPDRGSNCQRNKAQASTEGATTASASAGVEVGQ